MFSVRQLDFQVGLHRATGSSANHLLPKESLSLRPSLRYSQSSPVPRSDLSRPLPCGICRRQERDSMSKEICISTTPHETRLAILENDELAEIYYERENEYTLAGSIYKGRVTRVLPGMQSAFVDLGLERDAFLYVTDFLELEDAEDTDELEKAAASGGNQPPREVRQGNGHDRGHKGGREQRESQASAEVERAPAASDAAAENDAQDAKAQDGDEAGAKRWRGRRRRR